jgi:prepilin-type N-terminal cleavage/methylation domain-containing protein
MKTDTPTTRNLTSSAAPSPRWVGHSCPTRGAAPTLHSALNTQRSALPRRRGLSLPEVLISLSISALLLTAVATAFSASASAIDINDRFFRASQAARVSVAQLTSQIRRCDSCQVGGTYDGVSNTVFANNIGIIYEDLLDGTLKNVTYKHDPTKNELQLVVNGTTVALAHNVTAVMFISDMAPDPVTLAKVPVNVTIDITVAVGNEQIHVRGSAVPRHVIIFR